MKIKKTKYNPHDNSFSREKMANPFSNDSINDRLKRSNAKDLFNNQVWEDLGNGYFKSHIIDNNKNFK
jgi:hypothetical protein